MSEAYSILLMALFSTGILTCLIAFWIGAATGARRESLEDLAGAVVQYGYHDPGCDVWESYGAECDCGFDEAYKDALRVLK